MLSDPSSPSRPWVLRGTSVGLPRARLCPCGGRSGLVPVVRRCSTAWRSRIPTRPPVLKTSEGSPGRSFAPTGAAAVSLWCYGTGAHAGVAKARPWESTYPTPTLQPAAPRWIGRPCTHPTAGLPYSWLAYLPYSRPTLHLPYTCRQRRTAPMSRGLPYTYPTVRPPCSRPPEADRARVPRPTLHLPYTCRQRRTAPMSRGLPYTPPCVERSRLVPPLPTLPSPRPSPRRLSPSLPYKDEPPAKPRRAHARDQVKPAHPEPTLQNQPGRAFKTLSPSTLSPSFLCTHPPERVKVREI